jgi:membrane protein DedA with SNARE-associated domain/rhodanese-related sulfurtransferase
LAVPVTSVSIRASRILAPTASFRFFPHQTNCVRCVIAAIAGFDRMNHLSIAELIHLVERHGYALLFFWVLAEQGALPIPSIPLLVAVGALIRVGRLNAASAMACCLAAALAADSVWFHFGRTRGKGVLRLICRVSLEPDSCVRVTENAFLKHGLNTLLIAKFVPGLNAVAAPLAGDSGAGVTRFLVTDSLGIIIWSGAYLSVGYLFSDQVEDALGYAQRLGSGVLVLIVGLLGAWILWKFIQRHRFLKKLEVARITPEELRSRIDAGEDLYIVDLRSALDDHSPAVPGAIRLSIEELPNNSKQIPRGREIILYCSCPNEASSARTALRLRSLGITQVRPLLGGAEAWDRMIQLRG